MDRIPPTSRDAFRCGDRPAHPRPGCWTACGRAVAVRLRWRRRCGPQGLSGPSVISRSASASSVGCVAPPRLRGGAGAFADVALCDAASHFGIGIGPGRRACSGGLSKISSCEASRAAQEPRRLQCQWCSTTRTPPRSACTSCARFRRRRGLRGEPIGHYSKAVGFPCMVCSLAMSAAGLATRAATRAYPSPSWSSSTAPLARTAPAPRVAQNVGHTSPRADRRVGATVAGEPQALREALRCAGGATARCPLHLAQTDGSMGC